MNKHHRDCIEICRVAGLNPTGIEHRGKHMAVVCDLWVSFYDLSDAVREKLWQRMREEPGGDYFFPAGLDLRGTAVTLLAEAGCTVPEIVSITGHTLQSATRILEKYLARTKAISDAAIFKFENAQATDFANQLQTSAAS
jgi:hypothetical protein